MLWKEIHCVQLVDPEKVGSFVKTYLKFFLWNQAKENGAQGSLKLIASNPSDAEQCLLVQKQ